MRSVNRMHERRFLELLLFCGLFVADCRWICATHLKPAAMVLVNSSSSSFHDFEGRILPYLTTFGVPFTVWDIASNQIPASLSDYSLLIIGHNHLDTTLQFLNGLQQQRISLAVSNGTGLVNFDNDLATADGTPRYQFVQEIFRFNYVSSFTNSFVRFPPGGFSPQPHYIVARHLPNEYFSVSNMLTAGLVVPTADTALVSTESSPLLVVANYGQGHAVQWASYDWMSALVKGPVFGMDDLVWRGFVWAARKPFILRGLPNFVTMRVDDVAGPLQWAHVACGVGFKPWAGVFIQDISDESSRDLAGMVHAGQVVASVHSLDTNGYFYFDHNSSTNWPDKVLARNFSIGTQWHQFYGIPISKVVIPHWYEIGNNAFSGLLAWGVEFVGTQMEPGLPYGAPWLRNGPYRVYDPPQNSRYNNRPEYYADSLQVPLHPEFDNQFFHCITEIRDDQGYQWLPSTNITQTIEHGTKQLRRALDSMVLANLFTHEIYLSGLSAGNLQTIFGAITNNLAAYEPIYVTLDDACRYARATRTSTIVESDYETESGLITVTLNGRADVNTLFYIFDGTEDSIISSMGLVPPFSDLNAVSVLKNQALAPVLFGNPLPSTIEVGHDATFTITALGTRPLSYQWRWNGTNLLDGPSISGSRTGTLTLKDVQWPQTGTYSVQVSNIAGTATSDGAQLKATTPAVLTSGMQAYWPLDEMSGSVAHDFQGTNDGVLKGTPIWAPGKLGGGLQFNGGKDYVSVADSATLGLSNQMSISLWFQPSRTLTSSSGRMDLLDKYGSYWIIENLSGDGRIGFCLNGGSPIAKSQRTTWQSNQWYHIVGTYDGVDLRLYVNGVQEGAILNVTNSNRTPYPVEIGGDSYGGYYFAGTMDEVAVWNRALSGTEVSLIYTNGLQGSGILNNKSRSLSIKIAANELNEEFFGVPGVSYELECSTNLIDWTRVTNMTAPSSGLLQFLQPKPHSGAAFYRLAH